MGSSSTELRYPCSIICRIHNKSGRIRPLFLCLEHIYFPADLDFFK